MKTWISDNFPLSELECQYFDICRDYDKDNCDFNNPCKIRQRLRHTLEPYVAKNNLAVQIELILSEE